jgi:hypothetical protein
MIIFSIEWAETRRFRRTTKDELHVTNLDRGRFLREVFVFDLVDDFRAWRCSPAEHCWKPHARTQ